MKKIFLFLLLSVFMLGDIDIVPDDPSGKSMFYSGLIILTPSYASAYSSKESGDNSKESSALKEKETQEETYAYYEKLAENKFVNAEEVFTEYGLKKLDMENMDIVELTETKVGILITDKKRNLALIPSKPEYNNLSYRETR